MDLIELVAVASSLRAVVAVIDAGEVSADEAHRAYLVGAADALERLEAASPPSDRTLFGRSFTVGGGTRPAKRSAGPVRALGYVGVSTDGQGESGAGLAAHRDRGGGTAAGVGARDRRQRGPVGRHDEAPGADRRARAARLS